MPPTHHPARTAARAKASPLTAEGYEPLRVTVRAANAQEAVLQPATLQIVFELALHMGRQGPLTRCQRFDERRVVGF